MTENIRNLDEYDFELKEQQVRVEYGGFSGVARIMRVGREALKWQVTIFSESGRLLSIQDGPEVHGKGLVIPSIVDIENAQHVINETIDQYIWDPMSQA